MDITTETLAARLGLKPGSIRHRVCITGSYFGLRPRKLPNGVDPAIVVDPLQKRFRRRICFQSEAEER